MPYDWLKVRGDAEDAPDGGAPVAILDLSPTIKTLEFQENVVFQAAPGKAISLGAGFSAGVQAEERTYVEEGAGVYTGSVTLPAGAILLDIIVHCVALWTAATSATMIVGDAADDDAYFVISDLKATDLVATESVSFSHTGGEQGADLVSTLTEGTPNTQVAMHVERRYLATERVITGKITSVGAGTAGRTRMIVVWVLPETAAATFVAA